jgi:hypothetical protein
MTDDAGLAIGTNRLSSHPPQRQNTRKSIPMISHRIRASDVKHAQNISTVAKRKDARGGQIASQQRLRPKCFGFFMSPSSLAIAGESMDEDDAGKMLVSTVASRRDRDLQIYSTSALSGSERARSP